MGLLFYSNKYSNGIAFIGEFETLGDAIKHADEDFSKGSAWFGFYEEWDTNKFNLGKVFGGRYAEGSNPFTALYSLERINGKYYFPTC